MKKYIYKSAVVAEIERIKKEECPIDTYEGIMKLFYFERFLSFIDTLEAKEINSADSFIEKACKWLDDNLHHYWGSISADPHNFLFDFRKAMEE